ncbi:hypothetical protein [Salipiger sp. CCB-MM3]|uniref:hypothetical protein n=1 Tax=Salipiger sp. CCB-MM3 TaxID=1792508 RepID=UPI0012F9929F|nr:hypothetical protein [Salipiger sp. CCB-MM3]
MLRQEIRSGARVRGGVPSLTPNQRLAKLDNIAQRISGLSEETLVISAEGLCFLRTATEQSLLKRFIERTGREVKTVVVFRKEKDWRESWESQLAKESSGVLNIALSENDDVSILGDWYFDKDSIINFWNPFNLIQIEFEAHINILEPLYREIGHPLDNIQATVFKNRRTPI